jgi:hypothetical protein
VPLTGQVMLTFMRITGPHIWVLKGFVLSERVFLYFIWPLYSLHCIRIDPLFEYTSGVAHTMFVLQLTDNRLCCASIEFLVVFNLTLVDVFFRFSHHVRVSKFAVCKLLLSIYRILYTSWPTNLHNLRNPWTGIHFVKTKIFFISHVFTTWSSNEIWYIMIHKEENL